MSDDTENFRYQSRINPKLDYTAQNTLEDALRQMEKQNYGTAKDLLRKVINKYGTHEEIGYRG